MAITARTPATREFAFDNHEFRFLARLVNEQTGIVLAEHKHDMVYSRLVRRLRALKLKSFSEYCELLKSDSANDEISHLVNAITTNLTSFFREAHHFDHLHDHVLQPLNRSTGDKRLRIWSAACSAGMEPYSIAMCMNSAITSIVNWDARILATDIDTNMLKAGMQGEYAVGEWENIPSHYRKHLRRDEKLIHMPDHLKNLIAFKHLNLLQPWPMKGIFDAVFCRNVVIYFDKQTQRVLFNRMADRIKPGGWLYIGHSENLTHVSDRFELCGRTILPENRMNPRHRPSMMERPRER